ncbi:Uncharacterised protein [Vibrio cholerae]|nr:Uncharacterised protein [Vibrio cholerae]CSI92448.1 Uncharacterised protein [Vibrio cholerae]
MQKEEVQIIAVTKADVLWLEIQGSVYLGCRVYLHAVRRLFAHISRSRLHPVTTALLFVEQTVSQPENRDFL